jgi:hypothetical protein
MCKEPIPGDHRSRHEEAMTELFGKKGLARLRAAHAKQFHRMG